MCVGEEQRARFLNYILNMHSVLCTDRTKHRARNLQLWAIFKPGQNQRINASRARTYSPVTSYI